MLTSMERAAVMDGRVDYFDSDGKQLREIDMSNDYYMSNRGETFPNWVEERIRSGNCTIKVWTANR